MKINYLIILLLFVILSCTIQNESTVKKNENISNQLNKKVSVSIAATQERTYIPTYRPIPLETSARQILIKDKQSHFHVIISNISQDTILIWSSNFSIGYFSLSFELCDSENNNSVIKRHQIMFDENSFQYILLKPGESTVVNVALADVSIWERFPIPPFNDINTFKLRAVLENIPPGDPMDKRPGDTSSIRNEKKYKLWSGKVYSNWETFYIENHTDTTCFHNLYF